MVIFIYILLPLQFPKCIFHSCYIILLLDVFHIQLTDIETTFSAWRTKTMLKNAVSGDLAPHQMFRFYHEFGITDTTSWSDLSYDHAEIILRTMKEEAMSGQIDPLAPFPPHQKITSESDGAPKLSIASTSRPKNGKQSS